MANECFAMEQKVDSDLRLVASTQTTNRGPWIPQQFYPRHFALDTSRSLCEITNNKDIFTILHRFKFLIFNFNDIIFIIIIL